MNYLRTARCEAGQASQKIVDLDGHADSHSDQRLRVTLDSVKRNGFDEHVGSQRNGWFYDMSGDTKEIADQESISLSGAKSRIQQGRKTLEAMLKACCRFQFDRHENILQCEAEGDDDDCQSRDRC